jgi:hypothetical protein
MMTSSRKSEDTFKGNSQAHLLLLAQSMIDQMIHYGFDMRGGDAVPRRPLFREIRQTSAVSAHIVPKLFDDLFGALN